MAAEVEPAIRNHMVAKTETFGGGLDDLRAFCAVVASKSRKALVIAKEALNGLEERDVDRGYRWEQGFTLEMYMHEDSQKSRDAFVATGKAADF